MLDNTLAIKYENLKELLQQYGTVAVAFSGGVDSTLLLKVAVDTLGIEKVLALTAAAASLPNRESDEAIEFCKDLGVRHIVTSKNIEEIPRFSENPSDRCYHCKKALFTGFQNAAAENGICFVAEGSNMDDTGDYRPGMRAIAELGIKSPLREAKLYKSEIRQLSKELGLSTATKPSFACLASRIAYGEEITEKKLSMVDRGEQYLKDMGFTQYRIRMHGDMARIELLPSEMDRFFEQSVRDSAYEYLKGLGFSYVSLDLGGYRTGSMNEVLNK